MPKIFNNNILNFFSFVILTLISLAFLDNIPSILDSYQPDSSGYIQFNPYRKSLYPYFIKIVDFLNFDILFIQRLIFSLSIVFLFFCLVNYGLKMYLGLIFLIFIFSNLYYVSYTGTILTESLFFSAINFFAGLMIINKHRDNLLLVFLGILLGIIWSLKSIGPVITVITLIYIFFFQKSKINIRNLFSLILPLLVIIILESFLFFKHHDDRKSVFYNVVIGKVFLTSGKNSFKIDNYPTKFHNVLKTSKSYYTDVNNFLINIKNPILRSEFSADYEVHAQYVFLDEVGISKNQKKELEDNYISLFLNFLKHNYIDYIHLSIINYVGQWSTGMRLIDNIKDYPLKNGIVQVSGYVNINSKIILLLSQTFFIILLISLNIFFLLSIINLKQMNLISFFSILSNLYLIVVSFANVATIRYLMPVYPIIVFLFLIVLDRLFRKSFN